MMSEEDTEEDQRPTYKWIGKVHLQKRQEPGDDSRFLSPGTLIIILLLLLLVLLLLLDHKVCLCSSPACYIYMF
jgi:hypothetical protein